MTQSPTSSSLPLRDQAAAWAVRLAGDDLLEADYLALEAWLAESPDHADSLAEAEGLWRALDADRAALDAALARSAPAVAVASVARPLRSSGGRARPWSLAAAGLIAAGVAAAIVLSPVIGSRPAVYVTAPGEQRTITLKDGSIIVMNGDSRLSVRLSGEERLVKMDDAEAAFDIAHEAERPFLVTVGESRVEVLGTAFDVRRDGASTEVRVSRGVVRVSDLADPSRNVRLTPGQAVRRADADDQFAVSDASTELAGWRSGTLVYEDRPLFEVAADLSRAYATPVRAVDGAAQLRFTGTLALDDQTSTLRRIEAFLPVTAARKDGVIELRLR